MHSSCCSAVPAFLIPVEAGPRPHPDPSPSCTCARHPLVTPGGRTQRVTWRVAGCNASNRVTRAGGQGKGRAGTCEPCPLGGWAFRDRLFFTQNEASGLFFAPFPAHNTSPPQPIVPNPAADHLTMLTTTTRIQADAGDPGTRSGRGNPVEDPQTSGTEIIIFCMRAGPPGGGGVSMRSWSEEPTRVPAHADALGRRLSPSRHKLRERASPRHGGPRS